nr:hypothetical protein BaRGS_015186 [Batillaria attramentaria]
MIFNRQAIQRLMPRDTFYFAIMRDPEERFISSLFYYGIAGNIARRFGLSDVRQAVALILQHPGLLDRTKPEYFNSMSADTGLEPALQHDPRAVGSHIDKLEQDLDLVLVVEYFDESLVLLKRKACLAMKDILYKKKNARKSETHVPLSPEDRQRFRQQQMADVLVYDHFYKRFWGEVLAYGPDFFNEVRHFREIQRDVADFCAGVVSVWDCLVVNDSAWNEKFLVTARECRLMKITELEMQTYLLERAGRSYKLGQQYRRFRPGRAEDTGRVQAFGVIG